MVYRWQPDSKRQAELDRLRCKMAHTERGWRGDNEALAEAMIDSYAREDEALRLELTLEAGADLQVQQLRHLGEISGPLQSGEVLF